MKKENSTSTSSSVPSSVSSVSFFSNPVNLIYGQIIIGFLFILLLALPENLKLVFYVVLLGLSFYINLTLNKIKQNPRTTANLIFLGVALGGDIAYNVFLYILGKRIWEGGNNLVSQQKKLLKEVKMGNTRKKVRDNELDNIEKMVDKIEED